MSNAGETFFTTVGCMDGRIQAPVAAFGKEKFSAEFPDTITEAGLVGQLFREPNPNLLSAIKTKIAISLEKHHSKGIIVHGHQECAGNPVNDETHKANVRKSVEVVKSLIGPSVPVIGVFVKRSSPDSSSWIVEELS